MKVFTDCLIVGGGAAGLSAALSLGRMSINAIVMDDDRPRNRPAKHMNNFPAQDGINPLEWRNAARANLEKYKSIEVHQGTFAEIRKDRSSFALTNKKGKIYEAKKIILAYGVEDRSPDILGYADLWGTSIFHCPFCHGFEVQGQRLALVSNGPMSEHMLPMIYGLSKDLIFFTNGPANVSDSFREKLWNQSVRLIEDKIVSLVAEGGQLKAIQLENRLMIDRDALFWTPSLPFQLKSDLAQKLGCERDDLGFVKVDDFCRTSVEGVFAAGDMTSMRHSVLYAASTGQMAGAAVTGELLQEAFGHG